MNKLRFVKVILLCSLFWAAFHIPVTLPAQDCNRDDIIHLPGKYIGPHTGSVRDISKEDLSRQQSVTNKLMSMVVNDHQPKGMNIIYGPTHFPPLPYLPNGINTGNRYNAAFYLKYFYCNHTRQVAEIAETHSVIEFRVNEWSYPSSFFVRKTVDEEDPETEVFGTIKNRPVWDENGYWTMKDTVYSAGREISHFHFLVTKNKELPFAYMTKKEFLVRLRKHYENRIDVTVNEWKNPTPEEAEYAKTRIGEDKAHYGKSIQNIDLFLSNSPEETLNEPAKVVSGGPPSEFENFDEGRYWVIIPNPSYYNQKAPKSTPHFIDLLFMIYEPEKACLNAKNDLLKIIDFRALRLIIESKGFSMGEPKK